MSNNLVLTWRKSSYSGDASGNCVEVAYTSHGAYIRDTKAPQHGRQHYSASAWGAFMVALSER